MSKVYFAFLSAALGVLIGRLTDFPVENQKLLSGIITVLVFLTIFPAMIGFRFGRIRELKLSPLVASFILNFIWSPLFAFALVKLLENELAFSVAAAILFPCPSMNAAYVLLSGGNLEVSTAIMGINFVVGAALYPFLLNFVAKEANYKIPVSQVAVSIFAVVFLPVVVGKIVSRIYQPSEKVRRDLTEISLNGLVFTVFFTKSHEINLVEVFSILPISIAFLLSTILLAEAISKLLRMKREEHLSYVFLTAGKNNSTVIAVLTLSGKYHLAVYVMIHQFVQILTLLLYSKKR
ncbi:Bile acid:sodium symporter [Ferroglobus placidus DSM 10642]|uniref:Bile acid:sodium symporter n=1 Tax=Ferroglobus placidus (strain DSM 10642 / AEDII12DO) TaxID=589924 RepID=D3S2L2_FERPA|nr:bile acid:sodium symporter [Ferroglobus placidus]ADC64542.1 Bile acid:sodium symporter [Ferroglobus placidus DSM 10642]